MYYLKNKTNKQTDKKLCPIHLQNSGFEENFRLSRQSFSPCTLLLPWPQVVTVPPAPVCLHTSLHGYIFFSSSLLCWNGKQHFCGACSFLPKHPRKALRIWGSSRWNSSGNKLFFCCTTSYHMPHTTLLPGSVFLGFFSLQSSSTRAGNVVLGNNTNAMEDLVQKCCQAQSSRSKLHHCPKISKGSCLLPWKPSLRLFVWRFSLT